MAGKMQECFPIRKAKGFSLIELVIAVAVMVIVAGVAGSLMSGYLSLYTTADDQASTRRRAQDVFDMLRVPLQMAGIGLPPSDLNHYFAVGGMPPVAQWGAPIEVVPNNTHTDCGNALRVVYALPSEIKNGPAELDTFSSKAGNAATIYSASLNLSTSLDILTSMPNRVVLDHDDTRAFITFPGSQMTPLEVTAATPKTLNLQGRPPLAAHIPSNDIFVSNTIAPFHDVFFVRAIVAYVGARPDGTKEFCLFETNTDDPSSTSPAFPVGANAADWVGFRIEGIHAVHFEQDPARRFVTVNLLVEGDTMDSSRIAGSARGEVERRWRDWYPTMVFNPDILYEHFSITLRTRNVRL